MTLSKETQIKALVLIGAIALTLAIHYGLVFEPLFGDSHWIHALHGRFCYIPIVIAASWFGLYGALGAAAVISLGALLYILGNDFSAHTLADEYTEIIFYFAIAGLAGWLVDRQIFQRQRNAEMQLHLERSHKLSLVGQMAAGVAHEIKNPLASIKGAVEILQDEGAPAQDRAEFKAIALNEIKRIDRTVAEFLTFARPTRSQFSPLDLSTLFRNSARQFQAQASGADVKLREEISDGITVVGDRDRLHQVALNLLLNALSVSPAGAEIIISLAREADHATLVVRDHGPGLRGEDPERVFDPFYTTKTTGSGLGLAIVRSIVEDHGGEVTLTNAPQGGAVARVTLPLGEGAA
ncbi:MAG TPA: ATP-binding protein [candidate division Zixibacteria bacterium]|nr:ATP-binding protein [candidate division Zixibacteria bacterium]